jgi:hypothetical protein
MCGIGDYAGVQHSTQNCVTSSEKYIIDSWRAGNIGTWSCQQLHTQWIEHFWHQRRRR